MENEALTLKHLTESLENLVVSRLDNLEKQIQVLLAAGGVSATPAQGTVSEKHESEPASSPPTGTPAGQQSLPGKSAGPIDPPPRVQPDAPAPPGPPPQQQQQQQEQQGPAKLPVSPPDGPPPMKASPPPPPAQQPADLEPPPTSRSLGGAAAVAAQLQAASTPPGPQFIEVQLQRPDVKATWGFLWDRPAFINNKRIIDDIVQDSPAGRSNKDQQDTEKRLKKGDLLVALDGNEGWDACSTLSKLLQVRLKFQRAPEANGHASVQSPQPDPETDPETAGRAGDPREIAPPGTVPQGEQQRSAEPMPPPEATESREKKIEKQMTLLRQLSDSKKESSTAQAYGVTSLMTQVEDLTKLANLLAQGEANQALALVQPLLRKQVRTGGGQNGEPQYEAVDQTEAASFLLEVMEVMESSNKSGNATTMPQP